MIYNDTTYTTHTYSYLIHFIDVTENYIRVHKTKTVSLSVGA